jgi:4-hydroxy-tetrahydrodipicolinate synthase
MSASFDLHGVVPPLITPRRPDGEVDQASLRRLIRFQVESGVDALWLLGSCGEFYLLTDEQRQTVMEVGIDAAAGDVPVLIGCVETNPDRSIAWGQRAKIAGADAIFITTPTYLPISQAEILRHCRKVREGVDLPLVLYNAQFATQTPIEVATVRVLADEGTLAGLKDSSGDWSGFRELVVELGGRTGFSIVTGNEHMMDATLLMGARGCIASTANVIPEVYAALYGAARRGDWPEAARLQNRATAINAYVRCGDPRGNFISRFFSGTKTALKVRGVIDHAVTGDPLLPPTRDEEAAVRVTLERHGVGPARVAAGPVSSASPRGR